MANIFGFGNKTGDWKQQPEISTQLETITIFPEEDTEIVEVVTAEQHTLVFLSSRGKLYQTNSGSFQRKLKAFEKIPPMKSLHAGYFHFLAVSDEDQPKAYGWGQNTKHQLGQKTKEKITKPTLLEGFEKITFHEIHCVGYGTFFFNSETKILYGCGSNYNHELGVSFQNTKILNTATKLHENVEKVFSGYSDHVFIIKTDGEIYGFGTNVAGQLSTKIEGAIQETPKKIQLDFPVEEISKIVSGYEHTALLTTDQKVYVAGIDRNTGFGSNLLKFQQYTHFKDKKILIKEIASGYDYLAYLTVDNEIWVGGVVFQQQKESQLRKIITVEKNVLVTTLRCCDHVFFTLNLENNYLNGDLERLFKKGTLADSKIKNIPVHKILIETRIGKSFDDVNQYLEENCKLNEIEDLLKWVYCEKMGNVKRTKEILSYFGIENPQKTKLLKNDLKKLLFDEETSDFTLLVKNDVDDDDEEEEEEDEELPVHKFILAARSGLFRDLFQNLETNLPKVKDYSGKSLETIELLITFLYTDEIPITADTDQEFIKEEFEDIVDYYQLYPKIPLMDIFEKCSKK
ncbi:btk-binding protein-related [Anaeramoeba flamelloides]|uniref:Btk-binding protein-related n=1 Tax=Anaeramoeba flamelloides TaxID=1746091 RepID=A0AAV7Z6X0_9EUKA|nr:btk-binding protein-related [Anaeramoeba flamelloides]